MSADADVLVVGAGPTGLTLALLLAQHDLSVIVVDKEDGPYALPRAAHIDHQTVRVFQSLGLAEAIVSDCRQTGRYDFLSADRQVLMRFDGSDAIGPGGWPIANMIHQPSLEQSLRDAVAQTPAIDLRFGCRFVSLAQQDGHVDATLIHRDEAKTLRTSFIVGADGARSPVRGALDIDCEDLGFDEPWLVVDAIVKDASRLPDINLQICDPARPTTCVLMGKGRHRWEFMLKPGEAPEAMADKAMVEQLLAPWDVEGAVEIERAVVYRFHARVARRWRVGRALLAGDAAHQMPPFAGQGLCSGIRDAANLSWKIAAVLQDGAGEALLDTYQREREPNVRAIIDMAIMMGRTVCITDADAAAARDQALLAARARGEGPGGPIAYPDISEGCIAAGTCGAGDYFPQAVASDGARLDDVLGPRAWLIARAGSAVAGASPGLDRFQLDDPKLAPFASGLAAWLDSHDAQAVLVRADRYAFGTGAPDALAADFRRQTAHI